jgi:hypothetical protein
MATTTTTRTGRTWYGRPVYGVEIADETGRIMFRSFSRQEAEKLAAKLRPLVADKPAGPLANLLAE